MTATRLSIGLAVSLPCLGLTTVVWHYRPVHWIRTHSFASSLYWTVRSWLWNYPLTPDFEIWDEGDPRHNEKWKKEKIRTVRIWDFLAPYFAERGYTLYVRDKLADPLSKRYPASSMINSSRLSYPYAPCICSNDSDFEVNIVASRVWAARDTEGRDVIIKAISGAVPTNELRALQLLHSEPLCNDPRNHTIPVIEYIEFNQQTFVVMPRWSSIVSSDFSTVGEIIRYARIFFEALVFLHENNITHGDITLQNMSVDVLMPCFRYPDYYVGHHGPERRYAFIDFEIAELPAENGAPSPRFEECRRRDITWLATTLETHLRCIEHVAPGIDEFLARMNKDAWDNLPDAATVLSDFDEICCRLSSSELTMPLEAYRWDHG
ncbi:hypothetical protein AGABI2DRAFT_74226 [Agaricus bisporus var. bisporus H97]|uniref:hypothetical protein n=1 Tax=Agaricus bisporus var. bisporus (strain H97 / ATCC MYA-4626 / FGSC 10389) TaxID=936046 RepID=UPI00029F60BB|nr:hypothetical protein AGABI2DRAFT_74226 [Agaricus bisporus var. bisporus H97]EKV44974.1 hypothetical protein AGABI2DRAFT_74226 [Agaricus bisporus var. bisporus H97]